MRGRARRWLVALALVGGPSSWLASGLAAAGGQTDLGQISPLVWVMVGLSVAGALITFAILFYALWKFRDPGARRRNHG